MTWISWLLPVLSVVSIAVAAIKWLRVAQREHYLAGSIIFMRRVWIAGRPVNAIEAVMLVGALVGHALAPDSFWPLLGCAGMVVLPIGLGYHGRTSPLNWTARLRRTAVVGAILLGLATLLLGWMSTLWLGGGWPGALSMAAVVSWYAIPDLVLWMAAPIERRLSQKFVVRAAGTLDRVAPVVVGITGSYGKTSTKWYVRDLVSGTRRVVASPASFNNRLGLARAINENLTDDAEVFVAEMGAYQPGEIADTCSWIPPRIAVLTAIGPVHLQRFKSEERIVEAKSEIFERADVAIINVDHPALADLAGRMRGRKVWRCGTSEGATDVRVRQDGRLLTIVAHGRALGEPVPTGPFPANLACAVAVALELGVPPGVVSERARRLAPTEHRQTTGRSEAGFEIIDDTFNSNPAGAARALDVLLSAGEPSGRRTVVTPGMVELGPQQHDANRRFAEAAAEVADHLVIVGRTNRRALLSGARGGPAEVVLVDNRDQAVGWVRKHLRAGDAVLYENDLPDHYP